MLPKGEKALMVVFLRGTGVGLPSPYNLVRGAPHPALTKAWLVLINKPWQRQLTCTLFQAEQLPLPT